MRREIAAAHSTVIARLAASAKAPASLRRISLGEALA
jgi:hypothetical protein